MTTLQQTHPPILVYEVWELEDGLHGSIIDDKPFWKAKRDYQTVYDIQGKEAHFMVCTNSPTITRKEAIKFAQAIYENKIRRFSCDLSPCQPRPIK